MSKRFKKTWRAFPTSALLFLIGVPGFLIACGNHPAMNLPPAPTATRTGQTPIAVVPTATPDKTRIPYPWPMQSRQNPFSWQALFVPADPSVYLELENDFLIYLVWSWQAVPTTFPFSP